MEQVIIMDHDPRPIEIGVGPRQTRIIHEEAVAMMTYHMINEALKGHSRIGVVSDDTDASSFTETVHGHASESSLSNMRTPTFSKKIAGKPNVQPIMSSLPPTMAASIV